MEHSVPLPLNRLTVHWQVPQLVSVQVEVTQVLQVCEGTRQVRQRVATQVLTHTTHTQTDIEVSEVSMLSCKDETKMEVWLL